MSNPNEYVMTLRELTNLLAGVPQEYEGLHVTLTLYTLGTERPSPKSGPIGKQRLSVYLRTSAEPSRRPKQWLVVLPVNDERYYFIRNIGGFDTMSRIEANGRLVPVNFPGL